jgi:hypothetical protein
MWTLEDDVLFLKYCPNIRDRCYHAMAKDSSCRPLEILNIRIKDIVFKMAGDRQYAEVVVCGKTGQRHIPLINSIPYVKDWLDIHPLKYIPDSYLICRLGKGRGRKLVAETSLNKTYVDHKKYFQSLLDSHPTSPSISPEDKLKIADLLEKPWNVYIFRHSALTQKSKILKKHVLRQHAGWTPTSNMHLCYVHYFGNESTESILEAYGLKPSAQEVDKLRPIQCPNCTELNKMDSRFCVKCRMILSYDAYTETVQDSNKFKDDITQLKYEHEKQMKGMNQQIDRLESTVSKVFSKISGGLNQLTGIESIDKKLMKKYAFDPDKII